MLSKRAVLERAFRAIEGLKTKPAMAPREVQQESFAVGELPEKPLRIEKRVTLLDGAATAHRFTDIFPHCPRCGSYYLYCANNIGNYECQTCELRDITESVARSPHRA